MDSSSIVRKTRMECVVKNSKKISLKTLLINSPFNWKYWLEKLVDKTTEMSRKN